VYPHRLTRLEKAVHEKLQDENPIVADQFLDCIVRSKHRRRYEDDPMHTDGNVNSNVIDNKPTFYEMRESALNAISSLNNPKLLKKAEKCIDNYRHQKSKF